MDYAEPTQSEKLQEERIDVIKQLAFLKNQLSLKNDEVNQLNATKAQVELELAMKKKELELFVEYEKNSIKEIIKSIKLSIQE